MRRFWSDLLASLYNIRDGIVQKKQELDEERAACEEEKEELRNQIAELEKNQVPELDVTIYDFLTAFYNVAPVGIYYEYIDDNDNNQYALWSFKEHYLKDLRNVPIGGYVWEEAPFPDDVRNYIKFRTGLNDTSYENIGNIDFIEAIKNNNVGSGFGLEVGTAEIDGTTYYVTMTD